MDFDTMTADELGEFAKKWRKYYDMGLINRKQWESGWLEIGEALAEK
jgi:hypothetical protein